MKSLRERSQSVKRNASRGRGIGARACAALITGELMVIAIDDEIRISKGNMPVVAREIQRIVDVLEGNDKPDARPAGICARCFENWGRRPQRPRMIVCQHHRIAAIQDGHGWKVARNLTAQQVASLRGGK